MTELKQVRRIPSTARSQPRFSPVVRMLRTGALAVAGDGSKSIAAALNFYNPPVRSPASQLLRLPSGWPAGLGWPLAGGTRAWVW